MVCVDEKLETFKKEYDNVSYYEEALYELTFSLRDATEKLLEECNPKSVECFIGFENEFCLRVLFKNKKDLDTAFEYLKLNHITTHKYINTNRFILNII